MPTPVDPVPAGRRRSRRRADTGAHASADTRADAGAHAGADTRADAGAPTPVPTPVRPRADARADAGPDTPRPRRHRPYQLERPVGGRLPVTPDLRRDPEDRQLRQPVIEGKTFKDLGADVEAIHLENCNNVTIRTNDFANVAQAITVANSTNVKIEWNRYSNIVGPHARVGKNRANFVQLVNVSRGYISHNKGKGGDTEDIVSLYRSGGTAASPFIVEYNHFQGTNWTSSSGSGIALGDDTSGYSIARYNTLLNPGQVGIFIAGGTNHKIIGNTIYGEKRTSSNVGLYVWNQYSSTCSGHEVRDNIVSWKNAAGSSNPAWDGGNCGTISGWTSNTWNANLNPRAPGHALRPWPTTCPLGRRRPAAHPDCAGLRLSSPVPSAGHDAPIRTDRLRRRAGSRSSSPLAGRRARQVLVHGRGARVHPIHRSSIPCLPRPQPPSAGVSSSAPPPSASPPPSAVPSPSAPPPRRGLLVRPVPVTTDLGPIYKKGHCNDIVIQGRTFKDLGLGVEAIHLERCKNVTIRANDFARVAQAITVIDSTNVRIEWNRYPAHPRAAQARPRQASGDVVQALCPGPLRPWHCHNKARRRPPRTS